MNNEFKELYQSLIHEGHITADVDMEPEYNNHARRMITAKYLETHGKDLWYETLENISDEIKGPILDNLNPIIGGRSHAVTSKICECLCEIVMHDQIHDVVPPDEVKAMLKESPQVQDREARLKALDKHYGFDTDQEEHELLDAARG